MGHNYEKLTIYQDSLKLARRIYRLTRPLNSFALVNQLIGSSVSIPSNIAEGSQRNSRADFLKFLRYSKGSSGELITQLKVLQEEPQADQPELNEIISAAEILNKQLQAFINHIERKP